MRHLASKTGMTGGALYRYFRSREDLVPAHFRAGMSELHEQLMACSACDDALATLRTYALAYADFAFSDPTRFRLMFLEEVHATEDAAVEFQSAATAYEEFIRRMAATIDAQILAGGDAKTNTDILYAGLHGAITLAITASELEIGNPRKFVEKTVDTILQGLANDGHRLLGVERVTHPASANA